MGIFLDEEEDPQLSLLLAVFDILARSWHISQTEVSNILYKYNLYEYITANYEWFNELAFDSIRIEIEDMLKNLGFDIKLYKKENKRGLKHA